MAAETNLPKTYRGWELEQLCPPIPTAICWGAWDPNRERGFTAVSIFECLDEIDLCEEEPRHRPALATTTRPTTKPTLPPCPADCDRGSFTIREGGLWQKECPTCQGVGLLLYFTCSVCSREFDCRTERPQAIDAQGADHDKAASFQCRACCREEALETLECVTVADRLRAIFDNLRSESPRVAIAAGMVECLALEFEDRARIAAGQS